MKIIILLIPVILADFTSDFLTEQKRYPRVRAAFNEKGNVIKQKLSTVGLETGNFYMMLVAYKDSDELDLYVRRKTTTQYTRLATYEICARSGELGPKRKQGDYQVPEGFYHINIFNPNSNFHLSLGINYPNTSDRRKTTAQDPGGDIFIHGSCVTIGCLPMTDDKIKELYVYAVHAKSNGQSKIPVYIFPFRMTDDLFSEYKRKMEGREDIIDFWTNLKSGYDRFASNSTELRFTIETDGDYVFSSELQ